MAIIIIILKISSACDISYAPLPGLMVSLQVFSTLVKSDGPFYSFSLSRFNNNVKVNPGANAHPPEA